MIKRSRVARATPLALSIIALFYLTRYFISLFYYPPLRHFAILRQLKIIYLFQSEDYLSSLFFISLISQLLHTLRLSTSYCHLSHLSQYQPYHLQLSQHLFIFHHLYPIPILHQPINTPIYIFFFFLS